MMPITDRGSYTVRLPSARFQPTFLTAMAVEIVQEARHHDAAVVRFRSRFINWRTVLAPGSPLKITWQDRTSPSSEFFGYITHVRPLQNHEEYYNFDVFAVGASRALRETGQTVWRNVSAPQVASRVARQFRLRPVVAEHPLRKPQIIQGGRTYWEVLTDLAEQIGYALWVSGTTLYFLPISQMVSQGFKSAPVLSALNPYKKSKTNPEYALLDLKSITGLTSEMSEYSSDQSGVVAAVPGSSSVSTRKRPGTAVRRNKKVISPYVDYIRDRAVYSKRDADALAQGRVENGLLAIDAMVESEGTSALRPYSPVYLETQSSSTSGWWVVKSVRHRMSRKDGPYICESVLSTDSIYPSSDGKPRGLQNLLAVPPRAQLELPAKTVLRPKKYSPVSGRTSDVDQAFEWIAV